MFRANAFLSCLALLLLCGCQDSRESARGFKLPQGDAEAGKAVYTAMNCQNCHSIRGQPQATTAGASTFRIGGLTTSPPTDGYLVSAIIHPSHVIKHQLDFESTLPSGDSRMRNFNEILTVQQVIDLVAYLQSVYAFDTSYDARTMP